MERAGRVIRKLKLDGMSAEEMARAAWPAAVGVRVAKHTDRVLLFGSSLVVEVEDAVWQNQLTTLRPHILKGLTHVLGPGIVESIEFRVALRRRPPLRSEMSHPSIDEADAIADPVLRRVYRTARRKATA
jgi:predicted nucleic acid-binding Zn ribbon protein